MRWFCLLILCIGVAIGFSGAQDSIERIGDSAKLRESSVVVRTDKIYAYAKQIAIGTVGAPSAESVDSALNRLLI